MNAITLTRASWQLVPEILTILKTKWSDTKTSYNTLKGYSELKARYPERDYYLLTPNGKVDEYGTFVLGIPGIIDMYYVDTLNPDVTPITKALAECKDIDWSKTLEVGSVHQRHFPTIENITKYRELKLEKCSTRSYHMDSSTAKKITFTVPNEVYLSSVKEEHAELINSLWPHAVGDATVPLVKEYIRNRKSFGLFKKDDDELVGWCLHLEYGGPGILQVKKEERKKGYGEILLRAITKYLGENDIDSHCFIVLNNIASMKLFKKVGYSEDYYGNWYTLSPAV